MATLALTSCGVETIEVYHLPKYLITFGEYQLRDTTEIEYSENRVIKTTHGIWETNYYYNASGELDSTGSIRNGSDEYPLMRYTYNNGKLVKSALIETDPVSGQKDEFMTFEYQYYGDTLITELQSEKYYDERTLEEMFFNAAGNISLVRKYSSPSLGSEMIHGANIHYTYDNNHTFSSDVHHARILGEWNSNNVISSEKTTPEGEVFNSQEFRYIYDNHDFPVVKLRNNDTIEKYVYY